MSDGLVESSREGAACVLTLRREAKLNALSTALEEELGRALTSEAVRASACVVLTGGARVFSAGADVSEMRGLDPAAILAYYAATGDVYERVAALAQPSVSAIAGYCLGGGLELALATDFRVAEASAVLRPARGRDRHRARAPAACTGSCGCSARRARRRWCCCATASRREEAHALGLLTEVVDDGEALPRALALAERLAGLPPLAVQTAKRLADVLPEASREAGLALERLAYGMLAQTEDAERAAAASPRGGSRRPR